MTLQEIKVLVSGADPVARHYFSEEKGRDYTYWQETRRLPLVSDDRHEEAWAFVVHHFTRSEGDTIALRLWKALDGDPRVGVRYQVDRQDDGWIHHIYDCEGY